MNKDEEKQLKSNLKEMRSDLKHYSDGDGVGQIDLMGMNLLKSQIAKAEKMLKDG